MDLKTAFGRRAAGPWQEKLHGLSAKFSALALLCLTAALLAFPREVQQSVKNSMLYCLTVLVPSLFPFMALTSFAVNSGVGEHLGALPGFLARYVFRLPGVCAVPILMSFLGGYPAGAKGASLLLEQGRITKEQAGRMMLFCVNPGVAFVVTFLGGTVFHSFQAGWLLFFAVTASGLLLGILAALKSPIPAKISCESAALSGSSVIRAASDASSAVLKMCSCIVLFSGLTTLLHGCGLYQLLSRILASLKLFTPMEAASLLSFLIEVTEGVGAASDLRVGPQFFAFGLAFGGACVHLQVFSFFSKFPIRKWKFFLFRLLHGCLAAGGYLLLSKLLPGSSVEALAPVGAVQGASALSGTLAGGLSLLLMCLAFLLITTKEKKEA